MSEKLLVELNPPRVEVEPGGTTAEAVVGLHNLGNAVEQFTTEVVGLDPEWYTAPVSSVGLFPQDRDKVAIAFHPPKRPGMRAGSYPFRILVRARGGSLAESVDGVLDVRGYAVYRMDLTPRRRTSRKPGQFRLLFINSGTVDVRLSLEAKDPDEACTFRFPKEEAPFLPAGGKIELPLVVQANDRPLVGAEQSYEFVVTARPQDARGEPQTVSGQYNFRPLFASWAPLKRMLQMLVVFVILFVLADFAISTGVARQFPARVRITSAQLYRGFCMNDLVRGFCPNDAVRAAPEPDPDNCAYDFGFREIVEADGALVGACTTNVSYDGIGNGFQYSQNGLMVWIKTTNTVYFFTNDKVFAYIDGKIRTLDAPATLTATG